MTLQIPFRNQETELFFPMQLKQMTDEETKEYHLKKLFELSKKSLGQIPQLEDPNDEQSQWVKRKMRGSAKNWETWDK